MLPVRLLMRRATCAAHRGLFVVGRPFSTYYSKSHEWFKVDGKVGTLGITNHAQEQLGEIVFVDLPDVGKSASKGSGLLSLESVKAVGEVYSPVDGKVIEQNGELSNNPKLVNEEPESNGWLAKIEFQGEVSGMLTRDEYDQFVKEEAA